MQKSLQELFVSAFALVLCIAQVNAGDRVEKHKNSVTRKHIQNLVSDNAKRQKKGVEALKSDYDDLIKNAISIIRSPKMAKENPAALEKTISLLGHLRASESADALAGVISFYVPPPNEDHIGALDERYPVIGALTRIGKPGVAAILAYIIKDPENPVLVRGVVAIVEQVEGYDAGKKILQKRLKETNNSAEKKVLNSCLKLLEKIGSTE